MPRIRGADQSERERKVCRGFFSIPYELPNGSLTQIERLLKVAWQMSEREDQPSLISGLEDQPYWVRNSHDAKMRVHVRYGMEEVLRRLEASISLEASRFNTFSRISTKQS